CISILGFFNSQRNVVHQLFVQAVKDLTRGNEFTFFTTERRGVDVEEHGYGWFINGQGWQRFDVLRIADGVGDVQFTQTGDSDDVARFSDRSEEHTSELQSRENLVCRLLLEKKNK